MLESASDSYDSTLPADSRTGQIDLRDTRAAPVVALQYASA